MVGIKRLSRTLLLAALSASVTSTASNYPLHKLSDWTVYSEFGDEPMCELYSTAVHDSPSQEFPDMIRFILIWTPRKGPTLSLKGRLSANPSIRLENVDTHDSWDVTLAAPQRAITTRRVLLDGSRIDALVRNVGLGHPVAITVTDAQKTLRHVSTAIYAKTAVAMYRACVESLTAEPVKYTERPAESYFLPVRDGGCGLTQNFLSTEFPATVGLWLDDRGAQIQFARASIERTGHESRMKRRMPDRVDARQLVGESFDLFESKYYSITSAQLEELAADLSRGATRNITLTTPDGAQSTLAFGGPWGRTYAAMFGACREATFTSKPAAAR